MEDASGVDLDWFWRGWFYSIDHVDIALTDLKWFKISSKNPNIEKPFQKKQKDEEAKYISVLRDAVDVPITAVEADSALWDFYDTYDPFGITQKDSTEYEKYFDKLSSDQKSLIDTDVNFYQLTFENIGGLVMPLVIEFEFENGESQIERIPAEIWRKNSSEITKIFLFDKTLKKVVLDPHRELIDANYDNNFQFAPASYEKIELQLQSESPPNPMQIKQREKAAIKKAIEEVEEIDQEKVPTE
jgi:hypothetical protein